MVKIRLQRTGAKKQPSYRVVVADSRAKRDGRFVEIIGHYNPRTEPTTFVIKNDRAEYWLNNGAQVTDTVERLLRQAGVVAGAVTATPRWAQAKDKEAGKTGAAKTVAATKAPAAE